MQHMAVFQRTGQGAVGQWFLRMYAGEPDLGTVWHLISNQQTSLFDPSAKLPKVTWSPNFKSPEAFQLWHEPGRVMGLLSDWEGGRMPFAQFLLFR
jgi:hypothetical protein